MVPFNMIANIFSVADGMYAFPSGIHWRLGEALHPRERTSATKPERATQSDCNVKRNKTPSCWFRTVEKLSIHHPCVHNEQTQSDFELQSCCHVYRQ
jgi:hypothetical protein